MKLDEGAEKFIEFQQSAPTGRLVAPDGSYIQVVGDGEVVLVAKDHILMRMTEEENAASLDDPFLEMLAEELYATRIKVE